MMRLWWLAMVAAAPLAAHAASQDVTVVNRTGYQIDSIYVTELGNRSWGNDVLGNDKLEDGERVAISFDRKTPQCHWDLMVKYHDATQAVWNNLDLCELTQVSLFWDRNAGVTLARAR